MPEHFVADQKLIQAINSVNCFPNIDTSLIIPIVNFLITPYEALRESFSLLTKAKIKYLFRQIINFTKDFFLPYA